MAPGTDPKHRRCIGGGCKLMLAKLNRNVTFGAGSKEKEIKTK
jgi:hypothetical protein